MDALLLSLVAVGLAGQQASASAPVQDPSLDNLVHAPGTRTVPLGSLGRLELLGHGRHEIVLVPGFGFGGDVLRPLAEELRASARVLLVTPPGFGATPPPPMPEPRGSYAERAWCSAFEAGLLRALSDQGFEHPVLVGFMDGAQHAVRLALDHPDRVRAVASVSGEMSRDFPGITSADVRALMIDRRMAEAWFKTVTPTTWENGMGRPAWYSGSEDLAGELFRESLRPAIPTMVRYYCEKWSHDPRGELAQAALPLLAILPDEAELPEDPLYQSFIRTGLLDPWIGIEGKENLELEVLPGGRLGMVVERAGEIADVLLGFVERLP